MDDPRLIIDVAPSGDKAIVTARLGEQPLHVDTIDLRSAAARNRFTRSLCSKASAVDPEAIEAELLALAAKPIAPAADGAPEIDVSRIVRPERFILPEVSGLTVPTVAMRDGKPAGRWMLYLRWADGRREVTPLPPSVEIGGKAVFVHPEPAPPAINMPCGWSADARRRWLAGEPAPDPAEVFKAVCRQIAHYLDFPRDKAAGTTATLATWVLLTYCYPAWPAVPYLYFGGAKGCGKTTAFGVLERMAFRAFSSSNLTAAALFRTLHNQGGTLLFDEAERLRQSNDPAVGEVCSMLLAGYKRGGQATRLEPVGDTFRTVSFDVYCPKSLACIAGLPPALASRCITVLMLRAAPDSPKPRRRIDAEPERWQQVRDDLHALTLEYGETWRELASRDDVCPTMNGRDFELWQPLLALAAWLESHGAEGLLRLMQQHALQTIEAAADDSTFEPDAVLLGILADAVRAGERPAASDILAVAQEREPATFRNWTPRGVAQRLKYYGVQAVKISGRREYRATLDHLRQVQAVYGIDLGFDGAPRDV